MVLPKPSTLPDYPLMVLLLPIMVEPKACTSLLPPITVDRPAVSFTVLPTPATKAL